MAAKKVVNPIIAERLKLLRKEAELNQEETAAKLSRVRGTVIDRSLISKWETLFHAPEIENILALAEIFNSSAEYILGKSYIAHPEQQHNDILEILKNDPQARMVAKITGDLTAEGKRDLLKYAELLRTQRERGFDD